jgi:uncharacterized Zn-finger protein
MLTYLSDVDSDSGEEIIPSSCPLVINTTVNALLPAISHETSESGNRSCNKEDIMEQVIAVANDAHQSLNATPHSSEVNADLDIGVIKCAQCDSTFTSKNGHATHFTSKHENVKWKCMECGKQFTRRTSLLNHLHLHLGLTTVVCKICGKEFSRNNSLVEHFEREHGPKRPLRYYCLLCPIKKSFSTKQNLQKHMRHFHN